MGSKFYTILDWVRMKITSNDLFSRKITLTYEGKESFKTFCGGITSVILLLLLGVYAMYLTIIMFQK
jgi:hypothetical protein